MTQTATVRRIVGGNRAEIAVLRASACGHDCDDCGGCKVSDRPQVVALAENAVGAAVGDTVVVESATAHVLGIATVVYLVPFVLFFALYFMAGALNLSDGLALCFGFLGFLIGVAATILLNRMAGEKKKVAFRIVTIKRD